MKWEFKVVCPVCSRLGFPHIRQVQSYYYPRSEEEIYGYSGERIDISERKRKGMPKGKKYYSLYIYHYDKKKYSDQMKDYRSGIRKSRPNGRICHYVSKGSDLWIEPLPDTGESRFRTSYFSLMNLMKKFKKKEFRSKNG